MAEQLALLVNGARDLGFNLDTEQLEKFQLYYEMLVSWNSRMNLTAITDYEGVQVRHFLDSLTVAAALLNELGVEGPRPGVPPPDFSLIDVGTGAGFPGVPLKILWPHIQLSLADSVGKKTLFLKELAQTLGLENVEVLTARAEEHRQRHSCVTARAVAALPVLLEYCLPLVRVGGLLLAPKKGDISQELQGAERGARFVGGGQPRLHTFTLPGDEEARYVVAIPKLKPTPPGYPRRVGLAKARPLGS